MNIEKHITNLKKYIEEDFAFREPIKNMSDFDRYCWNHCKDIEAVLTAYEKEKEKNNKIDEFCRKQLAFERRLKREDTVPDEFNQGRFYVSENIRKIIKEE